MIFDYRHRWTPFTTSGLERNSIVDSSWELDEFGNISEFSPSLGINHIMSESKCTYNPLGNLRRNTRDMLTDFTYNLLE